jgi:ribose/xylose/arabinose/galactoside ABC-type transport system permease subunit
MSSPDPNAASTTAHPKSAAPGLSTFRRARRAAAHNLIWIILLATCCLGSTVQGFLSVNNLTNVFWESVPMGCMVVGMFFVMLTGNLDLSLESIYGVAPVLGIYIFGHYLVGFPPFVAVLVALAAGVFAGFLNGFFSVRLRVNPFLVTLAALLFWRGLVIALIPEGVYNLPPGFTVLGSYEVGGTVPIAIFVGVLVLALAYVVANHTAFGKAVYAIGSNRMAAYVAGIDVGTVQIAVFVLAGFLSALGGLIEAGRIGAVVDDLGQGSIIMVFAGAILGGTSLAGGRGRISGIIAAVLELSVITNVMNLIGVEPSVSQMVFALVLFVAILLASLQERAEVVTA